MLCEGTKAGCAGGVMLVWDVLVAAPLLLMCLVLAWVTKANCERHRTPRGHRDRRIRDRHPGLVRVIGLYSPWG